MTARRERRAARVILLDVCDRVLLFRFSPSWSAPFWVTPGGECDPGEDYAAAARRELFEETGIVGDPVPIEYVHEEDFQFMDYEPVHAVEHFFFLRTAAAAIETSGHTEFEREVMQEHRWFPRVEIGTLPEPIYPRNLLAVIDRVLDYERGLSP